MKMRDIIIACFLIVFFSWMVECRAADGNVLFIAELPTQGEFELFANGGWSGNWYVGYNQGWISKLPAVDAEFLDGKVYLGAKIGRAKTYGQIKKIYSAAGESLPGPGPYRLLIGVSSSKEEKPSGDLLVTTDRIPLEGSPNMALGGVGQSRWFWIEIPAERLSSVSPNYVHLWSPDEELSEVAVSPLLAGGIGSNDRENSWLVKDVQEIKPIKYFEPAIAIKIVGADSPAPRIRISAFEPHSVDPAKQVLKADVWGRMIMFFGIQLDDGSGWKDLRGYAVYGPPYEIAFNFKNLKPGQYRIRCKAVNWWEMTGFSDERTFSVQDNNE
jgi:hypothetical protein